MQISKPTVKQTVRKYNPKVVRAMANEVYVSQFKDVNGKWRRRLANGEIARGSSDTPYPKLRKELPGEGNN